MASGVEEAGDPGREDDEELEKGRGGSTGGRGRRWGGRWLRRRWGWCFVGGWIGGRARRGG